MNTTYGCILGIQKRADRINPHTDVAVIFKGCNLKCFWCPIPEAANLKREIMHFSDLCNECGKCILVCPQGAVHKNGKSFGFSRELCIGCGKCIEACDQDARIMAGITLSAQNVMNELEDVARQASNSRVTFTGGEPLLQNVFLKKLLCACKEKGYETAVVTAGNVALSKFAEIAPFVDTFYYSIKTMDEKKHKQIAGTSNKKVLANLSQLSRVAKEIIVTVPVLSDVNDTSQEILAIADYIKRLDKIKEVHLQPFSGIPVEKFQSLDMNNIYMEDTSVSDLVFLSLISVLKQNGINAYAVSEVDFDI